VHRVLEFLVPAGRTRRAAPRRAASHRAAPIPEDLEQNIKAAVKFGFSGLVSAVR